MKKLKKLLLSLLAVSVVFGCMEMNTKAADYNYTISISAGDKGSFSSGDKIINQVPAGANLVMDVQNLQQTQGLQVNDSRYYIKGIRLSGRDNTTADMYIAAGIVTADADYVVAYGVRGDMVNYTVQYQDEDGNELAPSRTYEGNVGDKPVVAYQYIEGYVPQALAMTGTLSDNAADNVFTFVYTPGESGTIVETVTGVTVVTPAGTTAGGTTAGTGTAAGTGAAAGAGTDAGAAGTDEAGTDTTDETQSPDEETPQALVDLDDEETPLGDIEADEESNDASAQGIPLAAGIATGVVAIIALAAIFVVFFKKRLH